MGNKIDRILEPTIDSTNEAETVAMQRRSYVEGLIEKIKFAGNLDEDRRSRFLEYADKYLADMERNLFMSQFELANKYDGTTPDEWTDFLTDNIVSKYVDKNKNMFIKITAQKNLTSVLGKGKKDSAMLIDKIEAKEQTDNKQNIIIMRIPAIEDRK